MKPKSLGILIMACTLPVVADECAQPPRPKAAIRSPQHGPARLHLSPDGTMGSDSWSGYAVTGSSFTDAKGSWIMPSVDCMKTPNARVSLWVGIDGLTPNSTVEQIGTVAECVRGMARYYAWYEFYPQSEVEIEDFLVAPNDNIKQR